jgi:hypothetical protein
MKKKDKELFEKLLKNQQTHLDESTFSGDLSELGNVIMPVIRRSFPNMIAQDIVDVQTMQPMSTEDWQRKQNNKRLRDVIQKDWDKRNKKNLLDEIDKL